MDVSKYEKTIIVHCPVCANTEFKVDTEESGQFACNDCNAEFSREELMTEHSEHIEAHKQEVAKQIIKDIKIKYKNTFS